MLPFQILKEIWILSDIDQDGNLDFPEFCVAMHLVVGVSKRGLSVPPTLPTALIPQAKAHLFPPLPTEIPEPEEPKAQEKVSYSSPPLAPSVCSLFHSW